MKRMIFTALIIVLVSVVSYARKFVADGKTFTSMGNFKIETADQLLVLNGVELSTYLITYDNSNLRITIAIDKDNKSCRFLTLSDKLSVQYVCCKSYFGIEKLDLKYGKAGLSTSDAALNRDAYFHQKVISTGDTDLISCMRLIASYYPSLLNDLEIVTASR
jgi:hypothetical protein